MGLNLGFIGKKISDIVGAAGHDVGNVVQGAEHAVGAFPGFANQVGSTIGNYVLHNAPVVSQAVQFGQQSGTPQFNQEPLLSQVGQFAGGIGSVGYQNSPIGGLQQAGGTLAATVTGKPQASFLENHQPIQNAPPVFGSKALGVGLAAANVPLELGGALGGVLGKVNPETLTAHSVPTPRVALRNLSAPLESQAGYIGGAKAAGFREAQAEGGVSPGVDQMPRFEASDVHAQFHLNPRNTTLAQTLDHPTLYQDYPQLAKVKVEYDNTLGAKAMGGYDPKTNTMMLNPKASRIQLEATVLHETQHAIQTIEGHAPGGSPFSSHVQGVANETGAKPMDVYRSLAGEAEARNVANRRYMTYDQQINKPFNTTYDVPASKQIVKFSSGEAKSISPNAKKAAKFLGVNPKEPSTAETMNAKIPALTPEKVAQASVRAKEIETKQVSGAIARAATAEKNPIKVKLAKVQPGDHAQAIANSQQIARPVGTAQQLWESSMRQLKSKSPGEFKDFWKAVEDPANPSHSPLLQRAISAWRAGADRAHAGSAALGKGVGYVENYARHPWDLSGWKEAEGLTGGGPFTRAERVHGTIAEGEAAGLKQTGDPLKEGSNYFKAAKSQLRKDTLVKGLTEADAGEKVKPHNLDLGFGTTVPLSNKAMQATRGLHPNVPSSKLAVKAIRTVNAGLKSTVLSLGQFHTINIGALRAAPTLIGTGHPVAAAKGLYGMFRGAFGRGYADRVIGKALNDGTVEKAAKIGMPYGSADYDVSGTFLKHGVGSRTVFGKQIPMMHDQVARSIISDLEKRNVPLDSPQARAAGLAGTHLMGEMNNELENISPKTQRVMSDWMLASQFTPSKFKQMGAALKPGNYTKGGVAGQYASTSVLANVAAATAIAAGVGYLAKQNSDNIKDLLLRSLVDPAVPTPAQDSKGNTIKLRLPGTDTSDIAKLLGLTLVRQNDGHLGVAWDPKTSLPDFLRARLSPLASAGVKLATNTTFAGKPMFDPNAPVSTQAQQAATSLVTGGLPIGLQGVAYTDAVKNHVPSAVKQVLDAQTPGSNPVVKSIGSSFGLTPSTDTTVGKGLQNSQYFNELDKAKKGLDRQAADALDLYTGSKKNPVTGAYDVKPNVNDQRAKATSLLQNPSAIDKLVGLNQNLQKDGQKIDPLWAASKEQITSYLQYQAMRPDGPDQKNWRLNNPWYQPLQQARSAFFDSLPPGDPNKPKAPIEYPQATPEVQALQSQFFTLQDPKARAQFIGAHPDLQAQFDAQFKYYNDLSSAQGYTPEKGHPVASPEIQAKLNAKDYKDPAVQQYLNQTSEYNIIQGGANAQFQGTNLSQSALKGIESIGQYGIVKNPDGTLAIAGSSQAQAGATSQAYKDKYPRSPRRPRRPFVRHFSSGSRVSGGGKSLGKVSFKTGGKRIAAAKTFTGGKPKVSIKKATA